MKDKIQKWYENFKTVPIYLGGMVPAESNNPDSGTSIALFTEDRANKIELGKSDEKGEFHGRIPKKYVGKKLFFPVRHAGFLFDHEYVYVVQPWGVFHAIKMTKDKVYSGSLTENETEFANTSVGEYQKSEAKTQYAARNEVSRTKWFWMATIIALLTVLFSIGMPKWVGFLASIAAFGFRAYFTNHALGFKKKPIH